MGFIDDHHNILGLSSRNPHQLHHVLFPHLLIVGLGHLDFKPHLLINEASQLRETLPSTAPKSYKQSVASRHLQHSHYLHQIHDPLLEHNQIQWLLRVAVIVLQKGFHPLLHGTHHAPSLHLVLHKFVDFIVCSALPQIIAHYLRKQEFARYLFRVLNLYILVVLLDHHFQVLFHATSNS